VLSDSPTKPLSPDTDRPSESTAVTIRSFAPENVISATARTATWSYVPAGTTRSISWTSGEIAFPLQSLPGLAPGRTVPLHVTVTV